MRNADLIKALSEHDEDANVIIVNDDTGTATDIDRACKSEDPSGPGGTSEVWLVLGDNV